MTTATRSSFFFFNDTATTEIYTLSLHDALPIWPRHGPPDDSSEGGYAPLGLPRPTLGASRRTRAAPRSPGFVPRDRKSTRLNSSHGYISYAVFCLKKKK